MAEKKTKRAGEMDCVVLLVFVKDVGSKCTTDLKVKFKLLLLSVVREHLSWGRRDDPCSWMSSYFSAL